MRPKFTVNFRHGERDNDESDLIRPQRDRRGARTERPMSC